MSDIFISYAREEIKAITHLAQVLESGGYTVFWDKKMPNAVNFEKKIKEEISASKLTLVVWSEISIKSNWVISEADFALEAGKYFPVMLGNATIPMPFTRVNTLMTSLPEGAPKILEAVVEAIGPRHAADDGDWRYFGGFSKGDALLGQLPITKPADKTRYELCRDLMLTQGLDNATFRKNADATLKQFTSDKTKATNPALDQKDATTALYLAHGLIAAYDSHGISIRDKKIRKNINFCRVYLNTVNGFLKEILELIKDNQKSVRYGLNYKEAYIASSISSLIKEPFETRNQVMSLKFEGKIHAAYLGGRLSSDHGPRIEASLSSLQKKIDEDIRITRNKPENDQRQRMLRLMRRTVLLSKACRKNEAAKRNYLDLLQNSWLETDVNAGFHLEYYGDQTRDILAPLCSKDEGHSCSHTVEYLTYSIRRQLDQDTPGPLFSVEAYTLGSIIGSRLYGDHDSDVRVALPLMEKVLRKIEDEDIQTFITLLLDVANSDKYFAAMELGLYMSAKNAPRNGWVRRGITFPESVGAHTASVIWLCNLLKQVDVDHYDANRVKRILEVHDIAEGITSDIVQSSKRLETEKEERRLMRRFSWLGLYLRPRTDLFDAFSLYDEFIKGSTQEARIARDLDRLDIVLQGQSILASSAREKCNAKEIEDMVERTKRQIETSDVKRIMDTVMHMNNIFSHSFGESLSSAIGKYYFTAAE